MEATARNTRPAGASSQALIRASFGVLNHTLPGLAARWAERLFFTPPRLAASPRVADFLATGRRSDVTVGGRRVAVWSWGRGPVVFLVHGWAGVGGQLSAFGPPLVARGFTVVTFDAPGHGASEGRLCSALDFAEALRVLAGAMGPAHAVIGHSFGAVGTAFALRAGLPVGRAVFVAPPASPTAWTSRFARELGIAPAVMRRMQVRAERRLGFGWADLELPAIGRDLDVPLLVAHDRDDPEVPWSDGAAIAAAWPGARVVTTTGLGHRRILRDPELVARVVSFVASDPDDDDVLPECGPWAIEHYLCRRETRW
jgi:pimeloyl-ACP methyl ester carboxylesterase